MNADQKKFADEMASYIQKYAPKYGIAVVSPILAQACLESGWGTSELATNAHNYFGIKYHKGRCPTCIDVYYKVGSEQKANGQYESSNMEWCKFKNREDCVIGYFDFINNNNYKNLKGITDPQKYLETIKADKYATSLRYVPKLMDVIRMNNLIQYDNTSSQPQSDILYRVQVGAYSVKANAEAMLAKLKKAGFEGFIVEGKK